MSKYGFGCCGDVYRFYYDNGGHYTVFCGESDMGQTARWKCPLCGHYDKPNNLKLIKKAMTNDR